MASQACNCRANSGCNTCVSCRRRLLNAAGTVAVGGVPWRLSALRQYAYAKSHHSQRCVGSRLHAHGRPGASELNYNNRTLDIAELQFVMGTEAEAFNNKATRNHSRFPASQLLARESSRLNRRSLRMLNPIHVVEFLPGHADMVAAHQIAFSRIPRMYFADD